MYKVYSWFREICKSDIFIAVYTRGTHKSNLTPKFIEGSDLYQSYGETYVFPEITIIH